MKKNPSAVNSPPVLTLQQLIKERIKFLGLSSQRTQPIPQKISNRTSRTHAEYLDAMAPYFQEMSDKCDIEHELDQIIKIPLFLPDSHCILCKKTIEEVGGRRITAQHFRGITFSVNRRGGGNPPYRSIKLSEYPFYLVIWGERSLWNQEAVQRATDAFHKGKKPWFCQKCGRRTCSICGAPINYPMASDLLNDDGSNPHLSIFPVKPTCINPTCQNYKEKCHV